MVQKPELLGIMARTRAWLSCGKGRPMNRFLFVLTIVLAAGCSGNSLHSTPEGRAVDAYMKEKLNDPAYEVVEWAPAAKSQAIREIMLNDYKKIVARCKQRSDYLEKTLNREHTKPAADIAAMDELARSQRLERIQQMKDELDEHVGQLIPSGCEIIMGIYSGSITYCRLRYRPSNPANGATEKNQVFSVSGGLATPVELPRASADEENQPVKSPKK